jgi:hypothetical protein
MEADLRFTPGMREQIDLGKLRREARHNAAAWFWLYEEPTAPMPEAVPFTLNELLDVDVAVEQFARRLTSIGKEARS